MGLQIGSHYGRLSLWKSLWKSLWRFLKKLNRELPYDPAISLLGIHSEKTITQKDTCTPMFTAVLFTTARSWKQPRWPLRYEWIKKMCYIYGMKYYSVMKS